MESANVSDRSITLRPIGYFSSNARYPSELPRQGCYGDTSLGRIDLVAHQGFEHALDDLAEFSHLWLIFQFHRHANWRPKVRPPRGSQRKIGVFATRSPHRPNPIGLSCVKFVQRQGLALWVTRSDLLDGTPILDIKPYIPPADSHPHATLGWLQPSTTLHVCPTALASEQMAWIESKTGYNLKQFLQQQLEHNPFDHKRKRVMTLSERDQQAHVGLIAFRTWRCLFAREANSTITIHRFFSAYSQAELASSTDPYRDKDLHQNYKLAFGPSTLWPDMQDRISFLLREVYTQEGEAVNNWSEFEKAEGQPIR